MKNALVIISVGIGSLICLQGLINNRLARALHEPMQAALISFAVGTIAIAIYMLFTRHAFPSIAALRQVSPQLYVGGVFGAIFITSVIYLLPKLGAATVVAATVAGQMIMAVMFDHFGWWEMSVHPLGLFRILGVILLMFGVVLIQRF